MGVDLKIINTVMDKVEDLSSLATITGFEGVEKRLEVAFIPIISSDHDRSRGLSYHEINNNKIIGSNLDGLRRLSHHEINNLLKLAECTIVSELHNNVFDSYVLSESSLFIYPHRIILKTCGRTQLLKCISLLLNYAASLCLEPCFCKYTHGTFIFPQNQPFPYTCFEEEVKYLNTFFGHMESQAFTMGNPGCPNWHIYSAATHTYTTSLTICEPLFTLEMGMTQLTTAFTSNFFNASGSKTGKEMTTQSRIDHILPNSSICDFAFAPCGYSMNGMDGAAFSTIHITPEESHSYASFEAMGYTSVQSVNLQELVDCAVSIFKPGRLVMSMHVSRTCCVQGSWGASVMPRGYVCDFTQREALPGDSVVTFHTFVLRNNEMKAQEGMQLITPEPLLIPCCGLAAAKEESSACRRGCVLSDNVCECNSLEKKEIDCTGREGICMQGMATSEKGELFLL